MSWKSERASVPGRRWTAAVVIVSVLSCRLVSRSGLLRGSASRRAREPVPAHDLAQRGEIGRAVSRRVEDGRDLAEVVGAENAWSDDRERLRVHVLCVVELVDRAPRN